MGHPGIAAKGEVTQISESVPHEKGVKTVKFNLHNFKLLRASLTEEAALTFLYSMILSHVEYCITCWSFTGVTNLKLVESMYKQVVKILDKKHFQYHHCNIKIVCMIY